MYETRLMRVDAANIEREHICCALSSDKKNRERATVKKSWLADRFPEGHVFLKAGIQGKAFIEYGPAEKAWFPLEAPGWLFAQCFWVAGRYAKASKREVAQPRFANGDRTDRLKRAAKGLDFFWSPQCPFIPPTAAMLAETACEARH
jgi:hypothetical protein